MNFNDCHYFKILDRENRQTDGFIGLLICKL